MKKLKFIMKYYKLQHLFNYYIVGSIISFLYLFGKYTELEGLALRIILFNPRYFLFCLASTLFYPFAMGVYLELKYKIMGNTSFNIIDIFLAIILFVLSIPVGLVKVILIYFEMGNDDNGVKCNVEYKSEDKSDDIIW